MIAHSLKLIAHVPAIMVGLFTSRSLVQIRSPAVRTSIPTHLRTEAQIFPHCMHCNVRRKNRSHHPESQSDKIGFDDDDYAVSPIVAVSPRCPPLYFT